jgi:hypothetical protein
MLDYERTVEYTRLNDSHTETLQDRYSVGAPDNSSVVVNGKVWSWLGQNQ